MTAVALALALHGFLQEQTLTLFSKSEAFHFTATKWKPADGRSLVVETMRSSLQTADVFYTYRNATRSGTVLRATVAQDSTVVPSRVMASWTTYRAIREVVDGPSFRFSDPRRPGGQGSASQPGQCWDATGEAAGMAGQSLEAYLFRDDRELFCCRSVIEEGKDGGFVVRFTVRNSSVKDALFEWGPYQEAIKAGKSQEFTARIDAAPKEADRTCKVSFTDDASYTFKANAWTAP